jgi:hypothetical protein
VDTFDRHGPHLTVADLSGIYQRPMSDAPGGRQRRALETIV